MKFVPPIYVPAFLYAAFFVAIVSQAPLYVTLPLFWLVFVERAVCYLLMRPLLNLLQNPEVAITNALVKFNELFKPQEG